MGIFRDGIYRIRVEGVTAASSTRSFEGPERLEVSARRISIEEFETFESAKAEDEQRVKKEITAIQCATEHAYKARHELLEVLEAAKRERDALKMERRRAEELQAKDATAPMPSPIASCEIRIYSVHELLPRLGGTVFVFSNLHEPPTVAALCQDRATQGYSWVVGDLHTGGAVKPFGYFRYWCEPPRVAQKSSEKDSAR